jgi:hypothetical protein
MIEVRRNSEGGPLDFEVVVREGAGETRHNVTMSHEMCERLTAGKHMPERCLEAAFRFLLDREPKESILRLRRDCDLALLPRIRAGAALPFAVLMELGMRCVRPDQTVAEKFDSRTPMVVGSLPSPTQGATPEHGSAPRTGLIDSAVRSAVHTRG